MTFGKDYKSRHARKRRMWELVTGIIPTLLAVACLVVLTLYMLHTFFP